MSDSGIVYKEMAFSEASKEKLAEWSKREAIKLQNQHKDYPFYLYLPWDGTQRYHMVCDWCERNLPKDSFIVEPDIDGTIEIRVRTEEQFLLVKLTYGGR